MLAVAYRWYSEDECLFDEVAHGTVSGALYPGHLSGRVAS